MSSIITVESLSKRYRLKHQAGNSNEGLRHVLNDAFSAPLRWLNRKPSTTGNASPVLSTQEDFWALNDVSFEIKQGEVVGIIGRNGAGKSTLLKILSRITEPSSGRIEIRGRVASLLEVGTGFHPELTGRENIFLNGAILGMSKVEIKAKFDEIVAFSEVERFLDTPVKRYSSGMYVRLAFAVAAHLEPEVLIVDEVLAVGDAEFQKKCLGKMESVSRREGRTVIFVTHQLGSARELCSRGILLEKGKLAADCSIGEVIDRYTGVSGQSQALGSNTIANVRMQSEERGDTASNAVFFGGKMEIVIDLQNLPEAPVGLNVSFKNHAGRLITLFSTNPHDGFELPKARQVTVCLSVDPVCLAPGIYTLDIALTEPAVRIIEEVSSALRFEVLRRSINGEWPYEARFGDCFPPHLWKIKKA